MAPLSTLLLSTLTLLPRALADAGTILFSISHNAEAQTAQLHRRSDILRRDLEKRQSGPVTVDLGNALDAGLYYANISVGNPGQPLMVQIDTGSSDVWVPSSAAPICQDQTSGGCPGGSFNPGDSSSFKVVGQGEFNISYVDGTGSLGDYFTDQFVIGGSSIQNFEMGIANSGTIGIGIMGIGYNNSEANVETGNGTVYPNLPDALVSAGVIKSAAYSLWLNDLQSSDGSILFGGVDTAKYTGDLIAIDVYPSSRSGRVSSFTVAFTSLSATSSSGTDQITPPNYAQPAILDSGTTITLLPDDVAQVIFQELGATISQELGATVVPCSLAQSKGTLNYGFGGAGGPVIKVSVSDLVLPLTLRNGHKPQYNNGEDACQLGIQPAGSLPVLFGDTFLRSAYAVYDLINNRVALAQTNFNSTQSNVVAFASSGAAIPSAINAQHEAQVTQTATGVPRVGASATASGTAGQATYNPTATGLSAASGFEMSATKSQSSTSTSTSAKKSAAGSGPEPFTWSRPVVVIVALFLTGIWSGLFLLF